MKVKVEKLMNNAFIIYDDNVQYLQSYDVIVAKIENELITLDSKYYDYSRTTMKHINNFLSMDFKDIRRRIIEQTINLDNLN